MENPINCCTFALGKKESEVLFGACPQLDNPDFENTTPVSLRVDRTPLAARNALAITELRWRNSAAYLLLCRLKEHAVTDTNKTHTPLES